MRMDFMRRGAVTSDDQPCTGATRSDPAPADAPRRSADEDDPRAALALLENVTEGAEELIGAIDPGFRFTFANRALRREFQRLFGAEVDVGTCLHQRLAHLPDEHAAVAELWQRALAGDDVFVTQAFGDPARERRVFDLRVYPLRDAADTVIGAAMIASDVTERVHSEHALRASRHALAEANRAKDEFLAVLSHELRNPLAPLRNVLQLLQMPQQAAAQPMLVAMMQRQVDQLVRLVDDLLEVSRMSHGEIALRRAPVSLADVVQAALETVAPLIDAGGHRLRVTLSQPPPVLDADAMRLAQVLSNLLGNAARFTPPGGLIELDAGVGGDGQLHIRVRDSGIGIEPAMLPRIFDMFVQAERSTRAPGGLGIGLTLARRLAQLHGGSLQAWSEGPGCGSEFTLTLPLARAASPAGQDRLPTVGACGGGRGTLD